MGLLPIFLTLTAFIFLWGMVNYNSFVAQQARINELREAEAGLAARFAEISSRLFNRLGAGSSPGVPGIPGPDALNPATPDFPLERADAWRRFVESHPSVRDREEMIPLLNELEETADGQYRARTRLVSAIAGYNGHRQRMPYRLIARLFNFKPIAQAA